MKITKINSNDCGGFKKPKGHLDTQLFPECEGTETDRDIVKKTEKKRNKKAFNLKECKLSAKNSPRSRARDDLGNIIEGPNMEKLNSSYFQKIKDRLEIKYPNIVWTLERVQEWVEENILDKSEPFEKPLDLYHGE